VCARVLGNDATINVAGAMGNFELNVFKPVLIVALLESARLLGDACASFRVRCVDGLEPDRERIAELVERSLMLVTALQPAIGYDRAAEVAKLAHEKGITLRQAAVDELGVISAEQFDAVVRPERMIGPSESAS
jgi:fumarate hydratase class II